MVSPAAVFRRLLADTGTSIAPDVLGRMFEPFFTTKGAEAGSGRKAC
jgi:C4-dicarboxylate-specific signal transduction histidine kinase